MTNQITLSNITYYPTTSEATIVTLSDDGYAQLEALTRLTEQIRRLINK